MVKTCEFVTPLHPDKICDQIADAVLDAYLASDPESWVAVEVMGGHGVINISGEVTSRSQVDIQEIAQKFSGPNYQILSRLVQQSPEIAAGVDCGGAGDQGIMVGYACQETENFLPLEYELARSLCRSVFEVYPHDGKVQITLRDGRPETVVVSMQQAARSDLEDLVRSLIQAEHYLINPAGDWQLGGLEADSGLSGRKLVIDAYGPNVPIGGGSFSGKDYTKVDRSGAYMARKIAVDLLRELGSREVLVKLAYAIGVRNPVMAVALIDGKEVDIFQEFPDRYDLSPRGIRESLQLQNYKFLELARWGHFGHSQDW